MMAACMVMCIVGVALIWLAKETPWVMMQRASAADHLVYWTGVGLLLAGASGVGMGAALAADSAHPRLSKQGCDVAADMVLVARSLNAAGVDRVKAGEIMALVYAHASDGGAIDKLRADLTDFSYRRAEIPTELSTAFRVLCYEASGTLDAILGSPVRWRR